MSPNDSRIHHNLGINLKRAGKLDDALNYYKKAIELEPDNPIILYNTGVLYNNKGDYKSATELLNKSIEL